MCSLSHTTAESSLWRAAIVIALAESKMWWFVSHCVPYLSSSSAHTLAPGAGVFLRCIVMCAAFRQLCAHKEHFCGTSPISRATEAISRGSGNL